MKKIIDAQRSIIPACDVSADVYERIVKETADISKVGAYKIGFSLMLAQGLPKISISGSSLYNHRGGACDIPDTGKVFMDALTPYKDIIGAIFTPLMGPATFDAWTDSAQQSGKSVYIEPIIGTETFLRSESGYVEDSSVHRIIEKGLEHKVAGFIFPEGDFSDYCIRRHGLSGKVIRRVAGKLESDLSEITSYDVMPYGLPSVVGIARKYTDKPLIYDHQKAGTDIPAKGVIFASICNKAGVDAVILFPMAGLESESQWIVDSHEKGLDVIIGGMMTHPQFKASEQGYIADCATDIVYELATEFGVTDFVVPGNRPEEISRILKLLTERKVDPVFYAPGFISQNGSISQAGKAAGSSWHAIVGRAIYGSDDIRAAALALTKEI